MAANSSIVNSPMQCSNSHGQSSTETGQLLDYLSPSPSPSHTNLPSSSDPLPIAPPTRAMRRLGPHRELDEVDFQIIIQLCLGKSQDAAGDWVCTPDFPAGISGRTVRKRIDIKRGAYDRLRERIGPALQKKQEEFEEVTKAHYLEKLGRLRSKGYLVKEKALTNAIDGHGDMALAVKVADGIEDRDFGRASQSFKLEGGFNVNHTVTMLPARTVIELARAIEESRQLLPASSSSSSLLAAPQTQTVLDAEFEDEVSSAAGSDDDDDDDFPSIPVAATPAFTDDSDTDTDSESSRTEHSQ